MDMQTTFPTIERLSPKLQRESLERYGVEFDEHGQPVWYTIDEWVDELDRKLADHFGDEYRELANKRRSRWNREGEIFAKLSSGFDNG